MIVFKTPIDTTRLRMAYNNDVLSFYDNFLIKPKYCDITLGETPIRLFPAPDGTFFLNLKPYVTSLINTRNFEDTLSPSIGGINPSAYVKAFTSGTYLQKEIHFTIYFQNDTQTQASYNLTWLAGVNQHTDYYRRSITDYFPLAPSKSNSTQHFYLKYWEGYPFDITMHMPNTQYFTLKNNTTTLSTQMLTRGRVSRLVLSDGRTDETLENVLPLIEGHNELRFKASSTDSDNDTFITLEKIPYKKGAYLKWLNSFGGYSYWLFENTYSIDRSTKYMGEIDNDYNNIDRSFGRSIQIGKESIDSYKITAELLSENERRIVEGILESPKVYFFTGKPLSQNNKNNWVEVTLKTGSARVKNPKQPLTNFTFDIELPQRYTISL
ncbi:hypothetical protein [Flavobacterium beibuense]|uniref:hypothetical protein n=1 Tax=Flavobacterium beibuense TaxID=657326 RepID=UPI003A92E1D9